MKRILFFFLLSFSVVDALPRSSETLLERKIFLEEERIFFLSSRPANAQAPFHLLIFLHGLEEGDDLCVSTLETFQKMEETARNLNLLLVFPIGVKGAFHENPDSLGWGPKFKRKNLAFLSAIVDQLKEEFILSSIILGGFSNGAYFLSNLMQEDEKNPYTGYWLQGGGNRKGIGQHTIRKKTVIEVGLSDHWHVNSVRSLKDHLTTNGWVMNENLIYRELECDHYLSLDYFIDNVLFLIGE